jgi:hypothetical protein
MPKPVRELLRLVHVEQIDLSQVKRVDFEIISYLKESHPDLYRSLRRAVKGHHRSGTSPDGGHQAVPVDELAHDLDTGDPMDLPRPNDGVVNGITRND